MNQITKSLYCIYSFIRMNETYNCLSKRQQDEEKKMAPLITKDRKKKEKTYIAYKLHKKCSK